MESEEGNASLFGFVFIVKKQKSKTKEKTQM